MAEEENKKAPIIKPIGGMVTDIDPIDQTPGTVRFAYNATIRDVVGALTTEKGNTIEFSLDTSFIPLGTIVINNSSADVRLVVFSYKWATIGATPAPSVSQIGTVSFSNTYTSIVDDTASDEKFNFDINFPIEGEYKINASGEVSIYWTDDKNPPRYLNLSKVPAGPQYTVQNFDLFPKISDYPQVQLEKIKSNGGALRSGAYQLSIAYMTEDGAITSYLDVSNPVYINDESEGQSQQPANSWGGSSLYSTDYNGCDGGTPTSKSIIWEVSNLDLNYKYIQPCIVRKIDQGRDAVVIDRVIIPTGGSSAKVFYSGVEESAQEILGAIQIPKESYTKAKTVAQVDDVLYWGNLERDKIDIGYQKFANSIRIFCKELNEDFDVSNTQNITGLGNVNINYTKSFGVDGYDSSTFKGYKRGEVYAFYITFVLKDGSETVAYHIPGRAPLEATSWRHGSGGTVYYEDETTNLGTRLNGGPVHHHIVSQIPHLGNGLPLWWFHLYMGQYTSSHAGGSMAYWQNRNEYYPTAGSDPNDNFETWTVDASGDSVALAQSTWLHGKNVRHHHFPLSEYSFTPSVAAPIHNQVGGFSVSRNYSIGDRIHAMNPQGIRINDVPLPDFVIDKCVAYKIYYLTKNLTDRVCVDSAMIQGGSINGPEHFNTFGEAWMTYPYQNLLSYTGGVQSDTMESPFFTTNPLDLMQSGESISSIDYVVIDPLLNTINGTDGTLGTPLANQKGFSLWATDNIGGDFALEHESHFSFDWTRNSRYWLGFAGNDNYNHRIKAIAGKTRVPSGSIISSATGFTKPIDNEGSTETIAFETYDGIEFTDNFRAIGSTVASWVVYDSNITANQINLTHAPTYADPTVNLPWYQDKLSVNFMSMKDDVHFGFDKQRDFVYTGYSRAINKNLAGAGGGYLDRSSVIGCGMCKKGSGPITMGGDVHIGYYSIDKFRKSDRFTYTVGATEWYESSIGHFNASGNRAASFRSFNGAPPPWSDSSFFNDYSVHVTITESRHNPNLKHANNDSELFYPAADINDPGIMNHDNASKHPGLYNLDYNASNNTRLIRAFDPDDILQTFTDHPTRMIRSVKYNRSGLEDNFRVYLPEDFRDLPRHRGELWKVKSYTNIIIPHMERALYITKGKETLKMADSSEAFLGSGDLFEKDPAEVLLTDRGYGGTGSQYASVTSQFGYFFVDRDAGKVFLMGEKLEEISMYGMRKFFRDNLSTGSQLEQYGLPKNYDNPIRGVGLIATYDPNLKRFLLTKKDLRKKTTQTWGSTWFFNKEKKWFEGNAGYMISQHYFEPYKEWTISYDPTSKAWVSFHSYKPHIYFSDLLTFSNCKIGYTASTQVVGLSSFYMHGSGNIGEYYDEDIEPFVVDCVDNTYPTLNKLFSSLNYTVDVLDYANNSPEIVNPFDYISVFNSSQVSQSMSTVNSRRDERTWSFNNFRDDTEYSSGYPITNTSIFHDTGGSAPSQPNAQTSEFFIGFNSDYIDAAKTWDQKRKFVDKWLGIRLISTNSNNNFVSLYMIDTNKRISYR